MAFVLIYSCSTEEEDTTPPPSVVATPEPEPPAPTQYTLTVTAGEGGSVSTEGGTYDEGTEITITATPDDGYEFVRWSDGQTDQSINYTLNNNTSLTAVFERLFYSLSTNEILIDDPEFDKGIFAGMVYHTSISGSFHYSYDGNQYLFIPGMACSFLGPLGEEIINTECDGVSGSDEVEPKPGLHFKKTSEGWQLLKIYNEVKTWGIRNFKVKDNHIVIGDGNEIGPGNWKGDIWYGEILGDEILWEKVNKEEEQSFYHGSTIGDLNNDGLMDIGGAPGRYVPGDPTNGLVDCFTPDETNGDAEFYIFYQNQNGKFSSVDVINYPLGQEGCKLFSNLEFTIEFENIDSDPNNEIIVSAYKDTYNYSRLLLNEMNSQAEEWYLNNINNIIIYKYDNESERFELSWNSNTPNVFYPNFGDNDHHGSTSMKIADFNNDGVKDISVAREYMDDLSFDIWLGNGDGTFEPHSKVSTGLDLSWREFSIMDVDNDGDIDIVLKSNFGYFTKDKVSTDDGYDNWQWGVTSPYEAGVNPNSIWKGIILNELIYLNDGTGSFNIYDEKPLYIEGIFPSQLIPYKKDNEFHLLGFRHFGYNEQNQLKTEFYDLELDL